ADRNRSHWSTSKTPSYTKSVSWQHHPFFSVPNVRINIRKYRDIPAEMSYAPGEHIKGGQE
ncbi:hypothetical protein ACK6UQ_22735, partial [Escherichia coli]